MRATRHCMISLLLLGFLPFAAQAAGSDCFPPDVLPENRFPVVRLETSMGDILVELNRCFSSHTQSFVTRWPI